MSTDLFTVKPDDLIDLAASVMDWRHIRHVPVEDEAGRLVGLVTHRGVLRMMSSGKRANTVREVMVANPVTVSPVDVIVGSNRNNAQQSCRLSSGRRRRSVSRHCYFVRLSRSVSEDFFSNTSLRVLDTQDRKFRKERKL